MSVLAGHAAQIWATETRVGGWQFRAGKQPTRFALYRRGAAARNDVARAESGAAGFIHSDKYIGTGIS